MDLDYLIIKRFVAMLSIYHLQKIYYEFSSENDVDVGCGSLLLLNDFFIWFKKFESEIREELNWIEKSTNSTINIKEPMVCTLSMQV